MGTVTLGVVTSPSDRVLSFYIGVETPGDVGRRTGGQEAERVLAGLESRGISG